MPTVIVEIVGEEVYIEPSSDEVDVLFFDWNRLRRSATAGEYAGIRDAYDAGNPQRAHRMADSVLHGEPWPKEN